MYLDPTARPRPSTSATTSRPTPTRPTTWSSVRGGAPAHAAAARELPRLAAALADCVRADADADSGASVGALNGSRRVRRRCCSATRTDVTLEAEKLVRDPHAVQVVRRRAARVRDLRLRERGRAGTLGHRRGRPAVWLADWFNEIVNALVLQASDQAPLWADDRADGIPVPRRAERRDLVHVRAGRDRLREAAAERSRGADPRHAEPARGRARPVDRQRRGRAFPARLGHVPLGVLVVEHAVRAADRDLRLPVVLPLRGLGLRLADAAHSAGRRLGGLAAINVAMALVFGVGFGWL